jgi:hypothetical protein
MGKAKWTEKAKSFGDSTSAGVGGYKATPVVPLLSYLQASDSDHQSMVEVGFTPSFYKSLLDYAPLASGRDSHVIHTPTRII